MNKLYTSMLLSLLAATMPAHQMSADAAPTTTKSKSGSSQMDTKLALKVAGGLAAVALCSTVGYVTYSQYKKNQNDESDKNLPSQKRTTSDNTTSRFRATSTMNEHID